jgi:hypothetical protein
MNKRERQRARSSDRESSVYETALRQTDREKEREREKQRQRE